MDTDRLTGTAKDVAGKVESGIGEMTGDKSTQASGRAREASGVVQNLYGQAKDAAREAGDAAMDYAKDTFGSSTDSLRDGTQALTKRVQDNPMGALLVAGGIGFMLAMLMRPSSRPQPQRWRY
ncbi:CsbD family protein [Bradyrhizobium sp. HKCCYLS20291]|uniref:CsbD family protein n=1 Tax=Bradyrhizobium sp. HKCCYLS20291 TaxID=3420766 RepID=UPI003EBE751B